ncbi:hypothetical protein JW859_02530 [bacterium]|nr:hypothetical protein [bacterium]
MTEPTDRALEPPGGRWTVHFWPAFTLGSIALIAQTILAREAMAAAAGHELMFGVMLAGWLAGQALCLVLTWRLGARLSRLWALLAASLALPASLVLLRGLTFALSPADGTRPALLTIAPVALLSALPVGLGLALAFSSIYHRARAELGERALKAVYAMETAGFLAGGVLWTFGLAGRVPHDLVLFMLPMLFIIGLAVRWQHWTRHLLASAVIMGAFFALLLCWALSGMGLRRPPAAGLELVRAMSGRQAHWLVARYDTEVSFYRNGRLTGSSGQPEMAAERVLLPLAECLRSTAGPAVVRKALHIGLRWPGVDSVAEQVDNVEFTWLENDALYGEMYRDYAGGRQAEPVHGSPLERIASGAYDLIILDLGSPASPDVEWAYSRRFFRYCRDHLPPDGVLAFSLDAEENYNSPALTALAHRISGDLAAVFPRVAVAPPVPVWYFAGNAAAQLTLDPAQIEARLAARGIANTFMSRWILADRLAPERAAAWQSAGLATDSADLAPLALAALRLELLANDPRLATAIGWLEANRLALGGVLILIMLGWPLLIVATAPAGRTSRPCALAYLAGFTCLAAEIALAWKLQAATGQLYWLVALLTALVLGGLFAGTVLAGLRLGDRLVLSTLVVLLAATALVCWGGGFDPLSLGALWALAALVPLALGLILGRLLAQPGDPLKLYAADLLGSALAALLVGTIGMLVWGAPACLAALALAWLNAAVLWRKPLPVPV